MLGRGWKKGALWKSCKDWSGEREAVFNLNSEHTVGKERFDDFNDFGREIGGGQFSQ